MNAKFAFLILLGMIGIAIEVQGQDAKTDLEKFQGEWTVTAMEREGQDAPKKQIENLVVILAGDKMTFTRKIEGAKKREFVIKLDPSKKPNRIDLVPQDGTGKGMTV